MSERLGFSDHVVYCQKQADGSVRRHNAIVLESRVHAYLNADRTAVGEDREHVDLLFVRHVAPGISLKTRSADAIFQPAIDVAPFEEGATSGYEVLQPNDPHYSIDVVEGLKAQLLQADANSATLEMSLAKCHQDLVAATAQLSEAQTEAGQLREEIVAAAAGKPSAEDLDKAAEEQKLAEATNGDS